MFLVLPLVQGRRKKDLNKITCFSFMYISSIPKNTSWIRLINIMPFFWCAWWIKVLSLTSSSSVQTKLWSFSFYYLSHRVAPDLAKRMQSLIGKFRVMSVSSIEDLAFEISYIEMVSNLVLCSDHLSKNTSQTYKDLDWVSFSSFLSINPFMSSHNVLK